MVFIHDSINWFSKLSYIAHSTSNLDSVSFRLQQRSSSTNLKISKNDSNQHVNDVPPPKEFFRLCRKGEWTLFAKKCQDEPHKLFWIGPQRQNLLHFICTRRPLKQSIIAFANIFPEALEKEDEDGCLPIHMAMTNGASHQVLCFMISKAPTTILHENKWHFKPFDWIWRRCKYELMHLNEDDDNYEEEMIWNTIDVMIQAASQQSGTLEKGTILHKAMDFDCPIDLVQSIISKFPLMSTMRDPIGCTPLARAMSSLHTPSKELITLLVQANPDVSLIHDDCGRNPLHLAIINRITWSEGLEDIFYAAPLCLLDEDPVTHLLPYQLIAIHSDDKDSSFNLSDIFVAMINSPGLFSSKK